MLAQVFRSIYDASLKYEPSSFMTRLSLTDFCPGDYVLLECALVRKMSPCKHTWTVHFEICSLSLLNGAPRASVPERDTGFRGEM